MTDEQIIRAYDKATGGRPMSPEGLDQARRFIAAVFDELSPVGYMDGDTFAQEEWELQYPEAIYRRPI